MLMILEVAAGVFIALFIISFISGGWLDHR